MTPPVRAVVPAAGASSRMGRCKPLLPLGDGTVLSRVLGLLRAGGVADVAVVVSADGGGEVAAAARAAGARVVENPDSGSDMAGSVRCALAAAEGAEDAVLVLPADHPLVSSATIATLLRAHAASPESIVVPVCGGRGGHPVLFPASAAAELFRLPTLRDVVHRVPARVLRVETADEGVLADMDTPEDYARVEAAARLTGAAGSRGEGT